jgi:CDGSH-type Zn-finger protein
MGNEVKIKVTAGGPYIVTGAPKIAVEEIVPDSDGGSEKWHAGREYDSEHEHALCRCGRSKTKPFCDGTHVHIGFTGVEVADRTPYEQSAKVFKGDSIELLDREELCAGARFCDRFGGVWKLAMSANDQHPEREQMAIYEASNCPGGRLTVRKNGELIEPKYEQEVGLVHDIAAGVKGPYAVRGDIALEAADGTIYEQRNRRALCRCGESRNMPFCDVSHRACDHMVGFEDE